MDRQLAAVLMAAGAGRRMGHVPKSLLLRGGEPLLLRHVRLLVQAGAAHIVVVLGHHAEALQAVLAQARVPPA
ncbi:MAG TPA: NTP transferase domain-containing protein, partial [Alicycliphilus sp.]|nr:NTP transferase domain-containing protein [Alicycliphilus sp.]